MTNDTRNIQTEQAAPLDETDMELMTLWVSRAAADTPISARIVRQLVRMPEPIAGSRT